jgi:Trypsin-like peptidase domain
MRQGRFSLSILVVVSAPCQVGAGCIDPATLVHSTASITRYFDDQEKESRPGVLGMSGTGWFLTPMSIVTVEHVAASMNLSERNWKQLEFWTGAYKRSVPVRIERLVGASTERLAVLELQTEFPGVPGLQPRAGPLLPEEPVVSLAYPDEHMRVVTGRFVQYGRDDKFAGMALLEMSDGDDRLALDYGSSGAPVVDCTGRVAAVVSKLFVSTIHYMSQAIRIPTAWGSPNVVSLPAGALRPLARVE